MFNYNFSNKIFINFFILIMLLKFIKSDTCTVKAICNIISSGTLTENNLTSDNQNIKLFTDDLNISTSSQPQLQLSSQNTFFQVKPNGTELLNCTYIDYKSNTTVIDPTPALPLVAFILFYPCPSASAATHYSTGTILIIIMFTCLFSYLGLGIGVNYFLVGARGIEMVPNLDFWRDFPALVLDGVKFIQNGFKARPSDLTSPTGQEGYDAI